MSQALLDNGNIRVVTELVAGAISSLGRSNGPNLLAERLWSTPIPARGSTTYGDDEADFLSDYQGGWHELFPNTGAGCRVLGIHMPFHGDAARATWEVTSYQQDCITLRCPSRLPVVLERSMRLEGDSLLIDEQVINECALDVPILWGHHPVFSATPETRIDLPGGTVRVDADWSPPQGDLTPGGTGTWPFAPSPNGMTDLSIIPEGPAERLVYIDDLPATWAALRDPVTGSGVAYAWDRKTFPSVWMWLQRGGREFPWFGRTSYVAVEPQSVGNALGLAEAIRNGNSLTVPGNSRLSTWLTARLFNATDSPVTYMDRSGMLHTGSESQLHQKGAG